MEGKLRGIHAIDTPHDIASAQSNASLARARLLVPAYTLVIFLSATLLFSVQPMFTKMALPLLGGAPNVWNTAMVFFQAVLLAGYLYAHFSAKYLTPRTQIVLHLAVVAIGVIVLPITVAYSAAPSAGFPALWLIGLFGASLGLPFFALSANAPLIQRWFSYTGHKDSHDPYFLYSASNIGSLLALCAYPFLIEPSIGLVAQSGLWKLGYIVLLLGIAGIGWLTIASGPAHSERKPDSVAAPSITMKLRAEWVAIAAVPSALMLGVTSHLSENVAAAPFLWVGPLAAYLLTFVIAFATNPLIRPQITQMLFPFVAVFSIIGFYIGYGGFFATITFSPDLLFPDCPVLPWASCRTETAGFKSHGILRRHVAGRRSWGRFYRVGRTRDFQRRLRISDPRHFERFGWRFIFKFT